MANYNVKFSFSTAKAGRGGSISGKGGSAECDITTDIPLEVLKAQPDDLQQVCYASIKDNPRVMKMGTIISITINDITQI